MTNNEKANEPLGISSEWMEARESNFAEAAFDAMEYGDTIAQMAAEDLLTFHRIVLDAVEETQIRGQHYKGE